MSIMRYFNYDVSCLITFLLMIYNLKKLSEEERYERHMLIQKFVTSDPYFQYLPQVTNPTNNHKKYSNKDLAAMHAVITEGVPVGTKADRQRKLYQQFCLEYDDMRDRHFIQMGAILSVLSRGTSGDNRRQENKEEKKQEEISLPKYQKKTSSYQQKYRTYHEEQFDDVIEFETQADLQQFQAFSNKYSLKISAKFNNPIDASQKQEELDSSKKKKKYVKKALEQQINLPRDVPLIDKQRTDHSIVSVDCFELNVQYAFVETGIDSHVTFEYEWVGRLPSQIYQISLKKEQLTIQGNSQLVSFRVPRLASDRTFLTFSQQKDHVVRATIGWQSYQGKYKLNHSMELPFEGKGYHPNQGVFFSYDQGEKDWLIASRPIAKEEGPKHEEKKVDRMVRDLIEDWQADNLRHQGQVREILMHVSVEQFYYSFLRQVSSLDKAKISKRVSLFSFLLSEKFNYLSFIKAWKRCLNYLHDKQQDYPFVMATLAKIMHLLLQKKGSLQDLYNNQEENEEIRGFIDGVFQRYYQYSKDEEVKKIVKIKRKFNDLI